jgi:hypothetical protein
MGRVVAFGWPGGGGRRGFGGSLARGFHDAADDAFHVLACPPAGLLGLFRLVRMLGQSCGEPFLKGHPGPAGGGFGHLERIQIKTFEMGEQMSSHGRVQGELGTRTTAWPRTRRIVTTWEAGLWRIKVEAPRDPGVDGAAFRQRSKKAVKAGAVSEFEDMPERHPFLFVAPPEEASIPLGCTSVLQSSCGDGKIMFYNFITFESSVPGEPGSGTKE